MDLSKFGRIYATLALAEQALVNDLAAVRVQERIRSEKDFTEALGKYDQLIHAALAAIQAAPNNRKSSVSMCHILFMHLFLHEEWLMNLQELLADRLLRMECGKLTDDEARTLDRLRAVVQSALSTNGDSPNRVPRSFERGIFGLMRQMGGWEYSLAQTDIRLGELVEAGWLRRTKAANNSLIYHAMPRFAVVAQSIHNDELPPPVAPTRPRIASAGAVTLPRLGWEQ